VDGAAVTAYLAAGLKRVNNRGQGMPRKIIIDTDPGQDDAVAILLALASPAELEVLGIVAVAGNVGLQQNAKSWRATKGSRSSPVASVRCDARS
jgi:hypothetical protein